MPEIVKPSSKFDTIELSDLGRRPTSPDDIKGLLTLLDSASGNFLEIGTWYGKTLFELAVRFPEKIFYTIDCLEAELTYEIAKTTRASREDLCKYAKMLPNVQFEYKLSENINYSDYDNISMVFIDGAHDYENVKKDTELALNHLVGNHGSIICWHDVINRKFGVRKYLETEIDDKYDRYTFENSQISYIKIGK